jgi:hypothetical protein
MWLRQAQPPDALMAEPVEAKSNINASQWRGHLEWSRHRKDKRDGATSSHPATENVENKQN